MRNLAGLTLHRRNMEALAPAVASTFSPTVKGTNATLSNGNRDLTVTSTVAIAKGTQFRNAGKYYFEIKFITLGASSAIRVGLADATTTDTLVLNGRLGEVTHSAGWRGLGFAFTALFTILRSDGKAQVVNDVVQVAVNFDTGCMWIGDNGTWYGATPDATTGATASFPANTSLCPAVSVLTSASSARIATGTSDFTYAPPSGYLPWL